MLATIKVANISMMLIRNLSLFLNICVCYLFIYLVCYMGAERSKINLQADRQQESIDKQNVWQHEENAIDRQFQEEQWEKQFAAEVEQQNAMFEKESQRWLEQFDLQNAYNAPRNQVARLMAAGINPSAMAGQISGMSNSSAAGLQSGGSSSSPNPSNSSSRPVGRGQVSVAGGFSTDAAIFSSVGQLSDTLGKLGVYGSETAALQRKVSSEIDKNLSEKAVNDANAAYTNTLDSLQRAFGGSRMSAEVQELLTRSFSNQCSGNQSEAVAAYNKAMEILTKDENARRNQLQPEVLANLQKYGILIGAQTENQKAQAAAARSEVPKNQSIASLNNALASTENSLREGKIKALDLQNSLDDVRRQISNRENIVDAATYQDRISAIVAQYEHAGLINKEIQADIDRKLRENDWIEVDKSLGALGNIVGMYGQMGVLGTKELNAMSRQQYVDGLSQYWEYLEQPDIQYKFNDRGRVVTVHGKGTKEYVNAHY